MKEDGYTERTSWKYRNILSYMRHHLSSRVRVLSEIIYTGIHDGRSIVTSTSHVYVASAAEVDGHTIFFFCYSTLFFPYIFAITFEHCVVSQFDKVFINEAQQYLRFKIFASLQRRSGKYTARLLHSSHIQVQRVHSVR